MDRYAAATALPTGTRPFEQPAGLDHVQTIQQSHERCRALGLTEQAIPELNPASAHGVRQAREQHQRLFEHAAPVMEMLLEQVVSTHSIVVLTDAQGNVLQTLGDPGFLERAEQVALAPGVNWAESTKGTNAVGTALFTEAPTLVHGGEHFLTAHRFLTCSASPLFDHTGQLMGVLDVSGHHSSYHPHTLAMVTLSARMIENQWFRDKFRHGLRLQFHPRPQMLGTLREGLVALAPDGHILGANRNALALLGLNMPALRKLGLEAVFGTGVGGLADHCRRNADAPLQLALQHGERAGERVHARALFTGPSFWPVGVALHKVPASPPPQVMPLVPSPAPTLQAQEMVAIRQAIDAAGGNISRAARQLGVARNTLYRKLRAAATAG